MPVARRNSSIHLRKSHRTRNITVGGLVLLGLFSLLMPEYFGSNLNIDFEGGRRNIIQSLPAVKDYVGRHSNISNQSLENIGSLLPKQLVDEVSRSEIQKRIVHSKNSLTLEESHSQDQKNAAGGDEAGIVLSTSQSTDPGSAKAVPGLPPVNQSDPAWQQRKASRAKRQEKRLSLLTSPEAPPLPPGSSPGSGGSAESGGSESSSRAVVRLLRDQLIMAKAYMGVAQQAGDVRLARELKARLKDTTKALGDATTDAQLQQPGAMEKMRAMGQLLSQARDLHYDCSTMVKKLRAMVQASEDQAKALKQQSTYLSQLAAKTMPRGLTCLTLRLTLEFTRLSAAEQAERRRRRAAAQERLHDNRLHHYALFSDNVLAASVVVNSTVVNAEDSSRHVFHVVTDKLNFMAMQMWFFVNPPLNATIEVASVDDFKWLNSSYCPVLKQLETASMKEYYFKSGGAESSRDGQFLKYRNPKYLSMLNHLRFYLPEVYPALNKILFVDDDIVVQRDVSGLWEVDLEGNVNGAVETCGTSFHRYDKYLNFSHPLIAQNFDPQACGWAYGMNIFDLEAWKKFDMTGVYHYWQSQNEDRLLWKLGTLPPGLITFYNKTKAIDKHWHALGMGYNPNLDMDELTKSAVVHYNGNMKPWLDIGMAKFKPFWTKYVNYNHPFLQQCNINPP